MDADERGAAAGAGGRRDRRRRAARRRPATSPTGCTGRRAPARIPIVVYFHGGGWVLGGHDSDDPFCRDLCVRSDAVIVSVDYRHAPEERFPAAADDAFAAVQWIAEHTVELGGDPRPARRRRLERGRQPRRRRLPAGARRRRAGDRRPAAAHAGHRLRHDPGVVRRERRRLHPDGGADGVVLGPLRRSRRPVGPARRRRCAPPTCRACRRRSSSRASSTRCATRASPTPTRWPPPACRSTAFTARGHTHTSLTMVDVVISGADARAEMATALRGFFSPDRVLNGFVPAEREQLG